MRRALQWLGLLWLAATPAAFAQKVADPGVVPARITKLVQTIDHDIAVVVALREKAVRDGAAVKVSCIDENLRGLRANAAAAKLVQSSWEGVDHTAAYTQRTTDRLDVIDVYASSYTEDARACNDAHDLKFKLEVVAPKQLPNEPPSWPIATEPTFERPPLASPF